MGIIRKQRKPKPRPKPVINYPPVPTRHWIPPDERKRPKPAPKYIKPEGISQKLANSTLKKVWNKYDLYDDAGILNGNFNLNHKRFSYKTNGYQGASISAVACVYSACYNMAVWTSNLLDEILLKGDALYVKSTQQGNKCLIEVPPEKLCTSFFLGNRRVTFAINSDEEIVEELTSASEEQARNIITSTLEKFLNHCQSGIFFINNKYTAIWQQAGVYYFFDSSGHDQYGNLWKGQPGYGVSFLGRFKILSTLTEYLYKNYPAVKEPYTKFHLVPCILSRTVQINTVPPDKFEDVAPQDIVCTAIIEENSKRGSNVISTPPRSNRLLVLVVPPPPDFQMETLKEYIEETRAIDPQHIKIQEISPLITEDFPAEKRPSFIQDGPINKQDYCHYGVPLPKYLKGEQARLTYYTELVPECMGILRGRTCQTDPKFSKYLGRQSMGNALSALMMLRIHKSKHWIPQLVNTILENGERLFRDAMLTIPRTHTLRLSNFPKKIEYNGHLFTPVIKEYALVGQMQSQNYEILDLEPALNQFLTENDCCIILGPQVLAVWIEDEQFYMFDPNERDPNGKAIPKPASAIVKTSIQNLDTVQGVACVTWFQNLKDLVDLYINNTEINRRSERFYLSSVLIKDYLDVSDDWFNFNGINIGKWLLRGTFSQASTRFGHESRNVQGQANAIIALTVQMLCDMKEWSSDTVDEILINGDNYYQSSILWLQDTGAFKNRHLLLSELKRSFGFRDREVVINVEECCVNGFVYANGTTDVADLEKGLERFLSGNNMGILTTRDISLAIWKDTDGIYYYLDPYSRDEFGLATGYGTSCVLRFLHLDDLVKSIEANLDPNIEDYFNINQITVTLYDIMQDGGALPPLHNYSTRNEKSAILRSWLSEKNEKYGIRKGRQTVPICLSAISFNKLKPSLEWTKNDVDEILDIGDDLYTQSMAKIQKGLDDDVIKTNVQAVDVKAGGDSKQKGISAPSIQRGFESERELSDDEETLSPEIKITSLNVKPQIDIGPNNLSIAFSDFAQGNIKELLKDSLRNFLNEEQSEENFNREALLETKHYTVALWRDDKLYYLFDPMPRDANGEFIGKEDWDEEIEDIVPVDEEEEADENVEHAEAGEDEEQELVEHEQKVAVPPPKPEEVIVQQAEEAMFQYGEDDREAGQPSVPKFARPKQSPSYWLQQEIAGRACTLWFLNPDDLIDFIYDNIPVGDRSKREFSLKKINITNNLNVRKKYNPEDERNDVYAGDWYDFKEFDQGQWILRGSLDLTHQLFPENNRGKQSLAASIVALAVAHTFEMTCFISTVPDSIVVYGDKLYSFIKKFRKKQLTTDPGTNLQEDEIDWIVENQHCTLVDIPKKICLWKFMVDIDIDPSEEVIRGDIKSENVEEILNVKAALEKFFETSTYGVLSAKDLNVAIWKGEKMFYMFDGFKRGPNGIQSTIGSACITRFMELEGLEKIFLENLPVLGKNMFTIHKVNLEKNLCPRSREPKPIIVAPKSIPKSVGLKVVMPGKCILSGTISQDHPSLGKEADKLSAPIAIVALTMSIIHKPETWSKPLIDEIILIGSELYDDSINELGFDFNPWEDKLDIYRVKNDFEIGVIKANCELRHTDQKGIIDIKDDNIKNLRQGLESFFEENTHGVLITQTLTVGIWEEQQNGDLVIYLYDPYPRSPTGMPLITGTACLMCFVNAKIASDHIIGCLSDQDKRFADFIIIPVEIVVDGTRMAATLLPKKTNTYSSLNTLPRCSKATISEQKKKLRKMDEEKRRRKEAKKLQAIGRHHGYHNITGCEAIIRGYKSQNSKCYDDSSRNKQDIPNCIVAVVMHTLLSIDSWNYRHIDMILNAGNQLYIDSYIAYGPHNVKLGMENVLRKFYFDNLQVHVTIYKPIVRERFVQSKVLSCLDAFFQRENTCLFNYQTQWLSLFMKTGFYYLFDPHERDIEGNILKTGQSGSTTNNGTAAVALRFNDLEMMAAKIIQNLIDRNGTSEEAEMLQINEEEENMEKDQFSLWLISVDIK